MSNNEKIKGAFTTFLVKAIPYAVLFVGGFLIGKFA